MVRSILAVLLIGALALSASAYDFLYSGDTAMTHDAGSFGISGGFLYMMADKYYDEDGNAEDGLMVHGYLDEDATFTGMWIPIDFYYSFTDEFEIGATPVFLIDKVDHGETEMRDEVTECKGTGIGDTWIWAKYAFMPEPMVTARVGFKVATGNDEPEEDDELATGTGQMDIDGGLMFGVPVGDMGQFDASVGYRYRMVRSAPEESRDEGDLKPGNEIQFYAGYTYFMNDMMALRLGADGFFGSDYEYDAPEVGRDLEAVDNSGMNAVYINPGFDYVMDNGVALGLDFHYPLMGTNIDYAVWGLGVSVGWGM